MSKEFTNKLPIMNFREAMAEICWNWQPCGCSWHQITRNLTNDYPYISIDKFEITPTHASYKTDNWELAPGVWERINAVLDVMLPLLEPLETDESNKEG